MNGLKKLDNKKRIVLIAHDNKKKELGEWVAEHKTELVKHELYATGTTGKIIEDMSGAPVTKLMSGPLGGDQQVGSMIAEGKLDVMIFFWDPMEAQAHDSDVKALLRLGAVWNVPLACNRATADFLITSPFMSGAYDVVTPDYAAYLNRKID